MGSKKRPMRKDNWGKTPDDPFLRQLYSDPERAGRISRWITIGLILFWIFFVLGMISFAAIMIFG